MVANFTVFGCCASRDVFNSTINKDYKNYFKIGPDAFHMTMISLMNDPVVYDDESITTFDGEISDYNLGLIRKDFDKSFLNNLKNDNFEYLVLDTYFDVMHGVIRLNNQNTFITNSKFVRQTDFYKKNTDKSIFTIKSNPSEYLKLWMDCCDKFFAFMDKFSPNTKIILNPVRSSTMVDDGNKIFEKEYYKKFIPNRCYRSVLDEYILNNYDIDTIILDKQHYLNENYFFGPAEIHYCNSYYDDVTNQLNEIIDCNNNFSSDVNAKMRILKRKVLLSLLKDDIELNNKDIIFNLMDALDNEIDLSTKLQLDSNIMKYFDNLLEHGHSKYYKLLKKYLTARFEFKNNGNSNNGVGILEISDHNSLIWYPNWLKDDAGQGLLIQNDTGHLHIKLRCLNDGDFDIKLLGPDVKDKKGNRIPIFIDFLSCKINNEECIEENLWSCFDKPYVFSRSVKDKEIIDIDLKWMPLNSSRLM